MSNSSVQSPGPSDGAAVDGMEPLRMLCHDLRQAVAAVHVLASMGVGDPVVTQRRLEAIVGQCEWLSAVIDVGLTPDEPRRDVDVTELVDAAVARASVAGVSTIVVRSAPGLTAWTCEVGLGRIVENLLDNATHAAGVGRVDVTVERRGCSIAIGIADDGPGFGEVETRTSLGLTIVRAMAVACAAVIFVPPDQTTGHRVEVILDAWDRAEPSR